MPYKDPEAKRAWRQRNAERNKEYNAEWRKTNAEAAKAMERRYRVKDANRRFHLNVYRLFSENIEKILSARSERESKHGRYRRSNRDAAIAFLGGRCEWCGFDNPICLEIDHIEPLKRRSNGVKGHNSTAFCRAILSGEEKNAQLLCANCHTLKTRLSGDFDVRDGEPFDPYAGVMV